MATSPDINSALSQVNSLSMFNTPAVAAPTPIDANALNQQVTGQSQSNAAASNSLEQQYNPYINSLRQASAGGLNQYLTPSAGSSQIQSGLMNQFNQQSNPLAASPLFTNAANTAQQQLNLGGTLDQETQNQIMRAGASKSGSMAGPGGGLGMGRDISARDLGLTSLQLQNQRMQNAASIGSTQQNYGLQAQQDQISNLMGLGNLANSMTQDQYNRQMALAQFTQGIQQPTVGLSPSSVAGIAVGNQNVAASYAQQQAALAAQRQAGQMQLAGVLAGLSSNTQPNQQSGAGSLSAGYGMQSSFNQPTQTQGATQGANPYQALPNGNIYGNYNPASVGTPGYFPTGWSGLGGGYDASGNPINSQGGDYGLGQFFNQLDSTDPSLSVG